MGNKKQTQRILSAILAFTAFFTLGLAQPAAAVATTQSMAIPAYEYPTLTNLWPFIDANASQIPFVIVNPASGPGVSANSDYTTRIANNTTAGIRSFGYVDTNYQTRSMTDVITDINLWYSLYPGISGIFLDRVSATGSPALCYSAYIYNYAKIRHTNDTVIHNFGTYTTPAYEPYGDIFVNAEMDHTLYQTWAAPADGFQNVGANANRFWHMVHTTSGGNLASTLNSTRNNNAGWVYITDDIMPNPYDAAPSYGAAELSGIASLPASTIPNRGITTLPTGCLDVTNNLLSVNSVSTTNGMTLTSSFTNDSNSYDLPSNTTTVSFSLPTGVALRSATGSNWNCSGNTCTYTAALSPGQTTSQLIAEVDSDCTYQSGNITVTQGWFSGMSEATSIAVTNRPSCTTLANTGENSFTIIAAGLAMITVGCGLIISQRRQAKGL